MSPTGKKRREGGFTLIELMVTMAMAGLMLAVVPSLLDKGGDRARLAHDRRGLLSQLRLARSEAIVGGHEVVMRFDLDHRRYGIGSLNQNIDDSVMISLQTPLADRSEIHFFADGSASGGIIQLTNSSGEASLQVDWLTGRVAALP